MIATVAVLQPFYAKRGWAVVWGRSARWSTGKTYDRINMKKIGTGENKVEELRDWL